MMMIMIDGRVSSLTPDVVVSGVEREEHRCSPVLPLGAVGDGAGDGAARGRPVQAAPRLAPHCRLSGAPHPRWTAAQKNILGQAWWVRRGECSGL